MIFNLVDIPFFYTCEYLLGLQHTGDSAAADVKDIFWSDFASQTTRKAKKRGCGGGGGDRVKRRGNRLALPAITFSSVRLLSNKMAELAALVKYDRNYHESSLIHVTASWLTEESRGIDLDGFTAIHFDRDKGKRVRRRERWR